MIKEINVIEQSVMTSSYYGELYFNFNIKNGNNNNDNFGYDADGNYFNDGYKNEYIKLINDIKSLIFNIIENNTIEITNKNSFGKFKGIYRKINIEKYQHECKLMLMNHLKNSIFYEVNNKFLDDAVNID